MPGARGAGGRPRHPFEDSAGVHLYGSSPHRQKAPFPNPMPHVAQPCLSPALTLLPGTTGTCLNQGSDRPSPPNTLPQLPTVLRASPVPTRDQRGGACPAPQDVTFFPSPLGEVSLGAWESPHPKPQPIRQPSASPCLSCWLPLAWVLAPHPPGPGQGFHPT